jgi:CheY-like chemotaxis protein
MPTLDGYGTAKLLRAHGFTQRIVGLTASVMNEQVSILNQPPPVYSTPDHYLGTFFSSFFEKERARAIV